MLQHGWDAATTENVLDSKGTNLSTSSSTTGDNFQLAQNHIGSFSNDIEKLFHLLGPGQFGLIKTIAYSKNSNVFFEVEASQGT
jgi:hypothetical protein